MSSRIVVDTNVYVSRLIREQSTPGRAVGRAWREATTLVSTETMIELRRVLHRPKLARFIQTGMIEAYIAQIMEVAQFVSNPPSIVACRDPRDDKFLSVAVHGQADLIVTGDVDLLALHPFRGISILTPLDYLERP